LQEKSLKKTLYFNKKRVFASMEALTYFKTKCCKKIRAINHRRVMTITAKAMAKIMKKRMVLTLFVSSSDIGTYPL
jgi:hypothetical protein